MDQTKIGLFIKTLREEKNLSQDNLAEIMYVDRSNISRWECGKAQIPSDKLKRLSEIFDVTLDELVAGERTDVNNKQEHSNLTFNFLIEKDNTIKKVKTLCMSIFILLILSILSFFIYYFIQTHNTERIYKITGSSSNYEILNGVLFVTREQAYLKIGMINDSNEEIELYYKDKGKYNKFFEGDSDNIIVDFTGYNNGINIRNIDGVKDNLYLKINDEEIKLILSEQYVNDNYILEDYTKVISANTTKEKNIPNKIANDFKCNEYYCTLINNNIELKYDIISNMFFLNDLDGQFMIEYNLNSNFFNYTSDILSYSVQNDKMICNSKKCNSYKETYNKYYTNLIKKYID